METKSKKHDSNYIEISESAKYTKYQNIPIIFYDNKGKLKYPSPIATQRTNLRRSKKLTKGFPKKKKRKEKYFI